MERTHLDRSRLPVDVCEHLCTKTMYTGSETRSLLEEYPGAGVSTAGFWCVFTQMPLGEDGDPVGPESCRSGRACCKPRLVPPEV
jgi:hypothetical protein